MHWQRLSSKYRGKKLRIHNPNPRDATCILMPIVDRHDLVDVRLEIAAFLKLAKGE